MSYNTHMTKDRLLQARVSADDIARLDQIRRQEPDLPTRALMIRRLIERATVGASGRAKLKRKHD